ncbi:hypothetical protein [Jeongeupia chitinilytica]|uniref:Uncharacterized protein n=1 Tax=Jeongeupia chitinilytica TaxID=1041641 RepID=A0ABQ3GXH7_9NEIS|nr:hypothetical protein [Jeongeupia chitinilytica]GHD56179.1 hypothetical protein GCM10007350_02760 [Jeongeupia chitinilytica]
MPAKTITFDGAIVAGVEVGAVAWSQAVALLGNPTTPPKQRECVAVAKLIEAKLICSAPTHHSYDVGVTIAGQRYRADIKTLYPSYEARHGHVALNQDLLDLIDRELAKEAKQGNVCLFDLSYLPTASRQTLVGVIHNTDPNAMTLEYDYAGLQLHFTLPCKHEVHRGNWYH